MSVTDSSHPKFQYLGDLQFRCSHPGCDYEWVVEPCTCPCRVGEPHCSDCYERECLVVMIELADDREAKGDGC